MTWIEIINDKQWLWERKNVVIASYFLNSPSSKRVELIIQEEKEGGGFGMPYVNLRLSPETTEEVIAELLAVLIKLQEAEKVENG